ncbi:Oidioi.mRNA.OKI2018_I69.XSR.g15804.t1.cds [Oikopleura dioica]|uniref:Oidioi.mRNA.OKI2018_I69.XSR.g15804.t1.cds n=1 Tax=Oikopleura dioica TaxID=34765 RepID=A0ABN7SLE0_OIKDI|nr:Oidioi.mRNA.OKI2018_I69.XSR.g15804.t1.cds [Oikopleura dioica]
MSETVASLPLSTTNWTRAPATIVCSSHICKICNWGTGDRSALLQHMREHNRTPPFPTKSTASDSGSVCASPNSSSNDASNEAWNTVDEAQMPSSVSEEINIETTQPQTKSYRLTPTGRARKPKTVELQPAPNTPFPHATFHSPPSSNTPTVSSSLIPYNCDAPLISRVSTPVPSETDRLTEGDLLVQAFSKQCSRVPLLSGPPRDESLPSLRVQIVRDPHKKRKVQPTHDENEQPLPDQDQLQLSCPTESSGNYDSIHYNCSDESLYETKRERAYYQLGSASTQTPLAVESTDHKELGPSEDTQSQVSLPFSSLDFIEDELDPYTKDFIQSYSQHDVQLESEAPSPVEMIDASQFQLRPSQSSPVDPSLSHFTHFQSNDPVDLQLVESSPWEAPTSESENSAQPHAIQVADTMMTRKRARKSPDAPVAKKRRTTRASTQRQQVASKTTTQRGKLAKPIATSTMLRGNQLIIGKQTIPLKQTKVTTKIGRNAGKIQVNGFQGQPEKKEQPIVRDKYGQRLCLTKRM